MVISRRKRTLDALIPAALLEGRALQLQACITILGVEVNDTLTFSNHLRNVAKKSRVCGASHLHDARSISAQYAAQVRSVMECVPLSTNVPQPLINGTNQC